MQQCKFSRLSLVEPVHEFPKQGDAITPPSYYSLDDGQLMLCKVGSFFGGCFPSVSIRTAATFFSVYRLEFACSTCWCTPGRL